jgi:hypothetical protein
VMWRLGTMPAAKLFECWAWRGLYMLPDIFRNFDLVFCRLQAKGFSDKRNLFS